MQTNQDILRLEHILQSIERIDFVLKNLSYGEYLEDWQKQDIIVRNMEIIGEASRHISDELKNLHSDVAWKPAVGMRNYLIHEYFSVNYDEVWTTLKEDLPIFKNQIKNILKTLTQ